MILLKKYIYTTWTLTTQFFLKYENLKNVKEAREQHNLTVEKLVCL